MLGNYYFAIVGPRDNPVFEMEFTPQMKSMDSSQSREQSYKVQSCTVEPRFNEVAVDRPNLFVKWRFRFIENLDITNLKGKDQNVRYIEVIVND